MRLVDAATIKVDTGNDWAPGREIANRSCAVDISLQDICDREADPVLLVEGGVVSKYVTRPIGVVADLELPAFCARDDDESWLTSVIKDAVDLAVSTALVTQPPSTAYGEGVWIGHEDVISVPFAGNSAEGFVLAIGRARTKWLRSVAHTNNEKPILHVSPELAPVLNRAGMLHISGTDTPNIATIWGDDVVMSPGYDSVAPVAFWTGPLEIIISDPETMLGRTLGKNQVSLQSSMIALIDIPPCTIVRVVTDLNGEADPAGVGGLYPSEDLYPGAAG